MKQVIYIDELLFINTSVNYFLLLTTSLLTKTSVSKFRILFGAFVGGLISLTVFLPPMNLLLSLLLKAAAAIILSLTTFGFKNFSFFLKRFVTLFLSTALFAGLISALLILFHSETAVYINTAVYFDVNIFVLIFSSAGCYLMIYFFKRFFKRDIPDEFTCQFEIELFGKTVKGIGMLDTGNTLREAFSSFPVAVISQRSCLPLFSEELIGKMESIDFDGVDEKLRKRLRIINCKTVSGIGTMAAFRPDRLTVKTLKRSYSTDRVYIALNKTGSYLNEKFDMILPSEIFEGAENE